MIHGVFSVPATALPEAALTPRQRMVQALAMAQVEFRAKQIGQIRQMTPDQQKLFEAYWHKRAERSLRAKEAQKEKKRAISARSQNPAPAPTKMWSKAMSLVAAADSRLTMGARCALQVIRALTARHKRVSRSGLAMVLGVHPRTAQRYLSELRERGYIRTRLIANRLGWVVAQLIEITEKVLPKHHRPNQALNLADGLERCISNDQTRRNQGETVLSPCKSKYQTIIRERGENGLLAAS